ncbi:Cu(I)-responsive transcriptional regulator [Donghicola eburneus]|uniref:Putative Cu(I)-responsive transcriptional regulator n=1 Tax=Donghicola eburneus TaxID=393278 RepID=A0A1M4N1S2_9RHOB|nr:Cu(I)-responsive transcriptional regulator [Donghicola eburneus]SCM68037.1 putative Cu(I)-responsive transcriptional regulator [Donghicola eburneus]SFQ52943.1 Cu(I)-responsive transcriptional regulator [Donghicola eburneus]
MNIKDVSERTKLPAKTIRYYEDIGLITPARGENGYRKFSENDLHKLAFVGRARHLGFSIEDCRNLLALWGDNGRSSADVRAIAQSHLEQIEAKLRELAEMRDTLARLVHCCAGDNRPDCPILEDLAKTHI